MDRISAKRESNMDLERVLLIFMVIVLHFNNRGMGGALNYAAVGGIKELFLRLTQSLSICAVDAFMILSGYFYTKKSTVPWKKAIWLLCTCSFYRVVGYVTYVCLVTGGFSIRTFIAYLIPSNWFVGLFAAVLCLSPFIGAGLEALDEKNLRELIIVLSVLFVIVPSVTSMGGDILGVDLNGLATISLNGDIDGFTIVSFIYCYICGYFIRHEKENVQKLPAWSFFMIYLLSAILSMGLSYTSEKVWSYSGIFTVICSVSLSLGFCRITVKNDVLGKIFGEIGGCGLGVFVWHTMPVMIYGYWVHLNIDSIGEGSMGHYVTVFLMATISMYVLSLVWVYACRSIVRVVSKTYRKTKNKG